MFSIMTAERLLTPMLFKNVFEILASRCIATLH